MLVQNSSTRYGPIHYNRIPSVSLILLANSGVGRKGAGNVRQTSVCRWFPPLVHRRKPRQTEVCRTFLDSPTVSSLRDAAGGMPRAGCRKRSEGSTWLKPKLVTERTLSSSV